MKTIFNKALWASAIGACTLSLGSCTDLSETIYDTIASEKYEFTEKDRAAMFAPVYSSLRDVYWGWYSWTSRPIHGVFLIGSVSAGGICTCLCTNISSIHR